MTDQEARNRADEIVRLVLTHGAAAASTVAAKLKVAFCEGEGSGIERARLAIRSAGPIPSPGASAAITMPGV